MIDMHEFRFNQSQFPKAELEKYRGRYVAWSLDGTHIIAADPDALRVDALLCEAGYDPSEILVSRIALPEEVSWGGWMLAEERWIVAGVGTPTPIGIKLS
jgi:hypothetical protein